ncbi:hypothetical protein HanLR1_Chr00c1229g0797521 [Helianthus annuus]|nr:hypothetical protein HanLR1_Chr00c1229g0797521 [Helianthus annuus]
MDMDVFGLRPMVDPLILVSCNSCKKPVKVSQYANHAGNKIFVILYVLYGGTGMLNVLAPLATKIFYSQRNQRFRSAISHMYYRSSSSTQHDHDLGYIHFSEIDEHREKVCIIIKIFFSDLVCIDSVLTHGGWRLKIKCGGGVL